MPAQSTTVEDRFWAKVNTAGPVPEYRPDLGPCWIWRGARWSHGYGSFYAGPGRSQRVHRFAYELLVGPVPEGLVLDHLCRVKACVNPAHLEAVTQGENIRRLNVNYKTHCIHGHPLSGDNIRIEPSGKRRCWACRRKWRAEYRARRRAAERARKEQAQ
jgi:hypothetical protein